MDSELSGAYQTCDSCGAQAFISSKFCAQCGGLQRRSDEIEMPANWAGLNQVAIFFGIDLVICLLLKFVDSLGTFNWLIFGDAIMALSAILFFAYNWSDNRRLLSWPNFSIQKLSLYCAIALAGSLTVSFIVNWLNLTLFSKETSYYLFFLASGHGKWWMIFCTAVSPAFFEELGYRGVILQNLTKYIDARQAIFITSFLFAIIHLSFLSLFWLMPFALFLAWVRLKEDTIWYGVCFHFCFNLTVCMLEIWGK